jgi:hypothetical protein
MVAMPVHEVVAESCDDDEQYEHRLACQQPADRVARLVPGHDQANGRDDQNYHQHAGGAPE